MKVNGWVALVFLQLFGKIRQLSFCIEGRVLLVIVIVPVI